MASRTVDQEHYRFGFNGKENDSETSTQDYGMRVYNPALGRFLSVDPLSPKYPFYTPYQFAGNKPINSIDIDGLEDILIITRQFQITLNGEPFIVTYTTKMVLPAGMESGPMGPGVLIASQEVNSDKVSFYFQPPLNAVFSTTSEASDDSWYCGYFEQMGITSGSDGDGIRWTLKDGQGQETRKGRFDVKTEELDLLLKAITAFCDFDTPELKNFILDDIYEGWHLAVDPYEKIKDFKEAVEDELPEPKKDTMYRNTLQSEFGKTRTWRQDDTIFNKNKETTKSLEKDGWSKTRDKATEKGSKQIGPPQIGPGK